MTICNDRLDKPTSKKEIEEEINSKICLNNSTKLYKKDFCNGPLVISKPGLYILMENIIINFFPTIESTLKFNKLDKFGHPAAIKIIAEIGKLKIRLSLI